MLLPVFGKVLYLRNFYDLVDVQNREKTTSGGKTATRRSNGSSKTRTTIDGSSGGSMETSNVFIRNVQAGMKNLTITCIVLDVGKPIIVNEKPDSRSSSSSNNNNNNNGNGNNRNRIACLPKGKVEVRTVKVADTTASINMSVWNAPGRHLNSGDIIRVTRVSVVIWRNMLMLYTTKRGTIEKIDEFCMVFDETINMSEINSNVLECALSSVPSDYNNSISSTPSSSSYHSTNNNNNNNNNNSSSNNNSNNNIAPTYGNVTRDENVTASFGSIGNNNSYYKSGSGYLNGYNNNNNNNVLNDNAVVNNSIREEPKQLGYYYNVTMANNNKTVTNNLDVWSNRGNNANDGLLDGVPKKIAKRYPGGNNVNNNNHRGAAVINNSDHKNRFNNNDRSNSFPVVTTGSAVTTTNTTTTNNTTTTTTTTTTSAVTDVTYGNEMDGGDPKKKRTNNNLGFHYRSNNNKVTNANGRRTLLPNIIHDDDVTIYNSFNSNNTNVTDSYYDN